MAGALTTEPRCVIEPDCRFIFAPSFLLAEDADRDGRLLEGKALGTAELDDLSLLHDIVRKKDSNLADFAKERKAGSSVGKRKLKQVQKRTEAALIELIRQWDDQELDERGLRKAATKTMKTAWRDVFLAGLRAGGTKPPPGKRKKGDPLVTLGPGDDKWLKTATAHEMRFLNKFIDAIITNDWVMPLERRAAMYVKALDSFYDSARVIGLPNNVIIYWTGPHGETTCASCEFLFDNNPYTTATLPTTPRSGATLCLTNCKDWLYIRRVPPSQSKKVAAASKYTRGGLIKKLRKIKRVGHP